MVPLAAQGAASACGPAVPRSGIRWSAPLDRAVSLDRGAQSLRAALDAIASAAGVRLSYSAELLPLERDACVRFAGIPAGDALTAILRGTNSQLVMMGGDQVVVAPRRAAPPAHVDSADASGPNILERVVVTGTMDERPATAEVPAARDVIGSVQLRAQGVATLADALDGATPGMWMWGHPTSVLARYGSVRGASSLGTSAPRLFIDGIEVANPLVVTRFEPEAVERIEILRGPQGAALLGTDAINGVINIVSSHAGVAADEGHVRVRSSAGMAASEYAGQPALSQDHALTIRAGSPMKSGGLSFSAGSIGAYVPGGFSRHFTTTADYRTAGSRGTVDAFARMYSQRAGIPATLLLGARSTIADSITARLSDESQAMGQLTAGVTARLQTNDRFTHVFTAGIDGYRLNGLSDEDARLSVGLDSALRAARGDAQRATLRASSAARIGNGASSGSIAFTAEQSVLREHVAGDPLYTSPTATLSSTATNMRGTTGLTLLGNAMSVLPGVERSAAYFTAGVRLERNAGWSPVARWDALPTVGASVMHNLGVASVKLRSAYGEGLRLVASPSTPSWWAGIRRVPSSTPLEPERQSGVELGADVSFGRSLSFEVTRFDQRATNLVQRVVVGDSMAGASTATFQLQNVGRIANRGWEMSGAATRGRLSLTGAVSFVDSRVLTVARRYSGDLREGDRTLGVPSRTASLSGAWTEPHWQFNAGLSRAFDWLGYDRVALDQATLLMGSTATLTGAQLRSFWRPYAGTTHLRATFIRELRRGLALTASGENLLDVQRGEPDNATIVPGRTVSLGIRASF